MDDRKRDDRSRNFVVMLVISYGVMALIGLQLFLQHVRHDQLAGDLVSVGVVVALVALVVWGRRRNMFRRPGKR